MGEGQDRDASENQWERMIVKERRRWEWREEKREMFSRNLTWRDVYILDEESSRHKHFEWESNQEKHMDQSEVQVYEKNMDVTKDNINTQKHKVLNI